MRQMIIIPYKGDYGLKHITMELALALLCVVLFLCYSYLVSNRRFCAHISFLCYDRLVLEI